MPIVLNEPLSFLQRITEYMEHTYLINKACSLPDSIERLQVRHTHTCGSTNCRYCSWLYGENFVNKFGPEPKILLLPEQLKLLSVFRNNNSTVCGSDLSLNADPVLLDGLGSFYCCAVFSLWLNWRSEGLHSQHAWPLARICHSEMKDTEMEMRTAFCVHVDIFRSQ